MDKVENFISCALLTVVLFFMFAETALHVSKPEKNQWIKVWSSSIP